MALFICCEKSFLETVWGDVKIGSLLEETARKRIPCKIIHSLKDLEAYKALYESEHSSLVIISPSEQTLYERLAEFESVDIHKIIYANHFFKSDKGNYSSVMSDIYGSTEATVRYLADLGCKRIALFGIDRKGGQDALRCSSYESCIRQLHPPLVFEKTEGEGISLYALFQTCLDQLLRCDEKIDSVITAYDYQAIYLIHLLEQLDPDWRSKLKIISFGDMLLSALCSPSISTVSLQFAESAPVVVSLHRMMFRNTNVSRAQILMGHQIFRRESTESNGSAGTVFSGYDANVLLRPGEYDYFRMILRLERILFRFDTLDFRILYGICRGTPFSELADSLYLSLGTINYRTRKYREQLGSKRTDEVRRFIASIIDPEKFKEFIDKL